jgi:predicted dienelactone hydrolase
MEPAVGGGIDNESLKKITIPVFIVGSKQNDFLSYEDNALYYSKYIPRSKLTTLERGEGHFIFIDKCTPYGKFILKQICIDREGINRDEIHKEIFEAAYRFLADSL